MTTETNVERLEGIKEQLVLNVKLKIEDVNWLIQQAELAQEQERYIKDLIRATRRAYRDVTAYPKSTQRSFLLDCFRDFWDPEMVEKLVELDGEFK